MVRRGFIRSRNVWLLYFRYNENLIARIKLKFKAQWCAELKCWWINDQEGFIQELKSWNEIAVLESQHIYINNKVMLIHKVHCNSFGKKRYDEAKLYR